MTDILLSSTFDAIDEGVQIISPDFRYLYVNPAVARQGRKVREELLGRTMHECYPGIEQTPVFGAIASSLQKRAAATIETEFAFENGETAWFEVRIHPCPAGVIIWSVDVSARKRADAELRRAHMQTLRALATPVVRVHEGILLVPLIGEMDAARAAQMMDTILTRVAEEQARALIIDIAGVPQLDDAVARLLVQTTDAVRLLGARTIVTGIAGATARTIVSMGLDLGGLQTTSQLSDGLRLAQSMVWEEE